MTSPIASMKDAKAHLGKLSAELEEYLDDAYQKATARLMEDVGHLALYQSQKISVSWQ
jgi:hypothetical protein